MIKLRLITAIFCVLISVQCAFAGDFSRISSNEKITNALSALESIGEDSVISTLNGANKTQMPIRVIFRDLSVYGQGKCEAVTMKTNNGGLAILISNKHMGSTPQAIGALIAHESIHQAQTGTLQEEVLAWTTEARVWKRFSQENSALALDDSKLTKRLNYITTLYSQNGQASLQNIIATNPVYANLK